MRRVEYVERIFHLCFSALTVIKGEEENRQECEPLQGAEGYGEDGVMNGSCQQKNSHADGAPKTIWQIINGNGQEDSPQAVVKVKVGSLEQNREHEHKKDNKYKGSNRCQTRPKLFLILGCRQWHKW